MKILLRCGGTLNLPYNESNCRATVAVPAELLSLGLVGMAQELAHVERWSFSQRVEADVTTVQPVCERCAERFAVARSAS